MNWNDGILYSLFPRTEEGNILYLNDFILYCVLFGVVLIIAYLLGSINAPAAVEKRLKGDFARTGVTEYLALGDTYGLRPLVFAILFDTLKTAFSVFLAGFLFGFRYVFFFSWNPILYLTGLASVIGHLCPIFRNSRGDRGIAAYLAIALILTPIPAVLLAVTAVLLVRLTKLLTLGIAVSVALSPIAVQGVMQSMLEDAQYNPFIVLLEMITALIVLLACRKNISALINREEPKFSFSRFDYATGGKKQP